MKYIITESQSYEFMTNLLKREGVKFDILYLSDNGYDSIRGTVYLYKNNEIFGYRQGYDFFFKYDSRFNKLEYNGHTPNIERLSFLKFIPEDVIIKYFSDRVKSYLKKYIDDGYSTLRRK